MLRMKTYSAACLTHCSLSHALLALSRTAHCLTHRSLSHAPLALSRNARCLTHCSLSHAALPVSRTVATCWHVSQCVTACPRCACLTFRVGTTDNFIHDTEPFAVIERDVTSSRAQVGMLLWASSMNLNTPQADSSNKAGRVPTCSVSFCYSFKCFLFLLTCCYYH
jgi:hypothetical protein